MMMSLAVKGALFLLVFTLANPLRGSRTCAAYAPRQARIVNWNCREPSGCIWRSHGANGDQCEAEQEASTLFDEFIEKLKDQEAEGDDVQKLVKETLDNYRQREGQRNSEQHGKLTGSIALLDEKRARVDTLKRWLDSFRPLPPAVIFTIKRLYDVLYTYNSNAIEGNTLSISETELVVSHGITVGGKTIAEHLEIIGHQEAIQYVESSAKESTSISEYQIQTIHNLVCRGTMHEEAGKYRNSDVETTLTDGSRYRYVASYLVSQMMTDFVGWLNSCEAANLHPVEFAAEAHFRFVTIHPFIDGNGRVARLLMNLLLLRAGFPTAVVLNKDRDSYINALIAGRQGNDSLEEFKSLIFDACEISLIDFVRFACTAGDSRGKGLDFYREFLYSRQTSRK